MKKIVFLLLTVLFSAITFEANAQESFTDNNGHKWKTFTVNDTRVFLNVSKIQRFGRYVLLSLYIENNSDSTSIAYDFGATTIKSGNRVTNFLSRSEFEQSLRRRQRWNEFGLGVAAIATDITINSAIGTTSFGRHHRNFGEELLRGLVMSAIHVGTVIGFDAIATQQDMSIQNILQENIGYLKNYIIQPNHSISGFAYARYNPNRLEMFTVNIPLNGTIFAFQINPFEIESLAVEG